MKNQILCSLLLIILSVAARAQAPQSFSYQAVARDGSGGILVNQNICIQSTITDDSLGTMIYQETFNTTTNQFGLFTLRLGSGTVVSGNFTTISWETITPWLKIEIKIACSGSYVYMGTSPLISVPYALFAASGNPGPPGANGVNGTNGATWYTGSGIPTGGTGVINDLYLNTANGDYYKKTGSSSWTKQGNITGPSGPQGHPGDKYATSSTTTLGIISGTQNLLVDTGLSYSIGQNVLISNSVSNRMEGVLISYNSSTGIMQVNVTTITGSGTFSSWQVNLNGAPGPQGTAGATWYTGAGAPALALGTINDLYMDTNNGSYYKKTGASIWTFQANLTGPSGGNGSNGSNGTNGTNGATWYTGSGAPSGATGLVNDLYLNTSNGDYYKKTGASTWTLQANLTGPSGPNGANGTNGTNGSNGATWYTGPGIPSGGAGTISDLYLNTSNGDYYKKTGASTWTLQGNLIGPTGTNGTNGTNGSNGATWFTGTGAPSSGTGTVNDLYLNTSNGDYYKKTGAGTWTLQANFSGPAGTNGSNGASGTNGATWYTGSGAPAGGTGTVNDLYINTVTGDYYKKTGTSTWTLLANLKGPTGGYPVHYIGEYYGGGIVYYVYDNGQHGLIADTVDLSTGIRWHNGTYRYTGTEYSSLTDGIGAGEMNTTLIVATQIGDGGALQSFAAGLVASYSVLRNGVTYGDWYLPSLGELLLLYDQRAVVGGFSSGIYWSSNDDGSDYIIALNVNFSTGSSSYGYKYHIRSVRAIRAF